MHKIYIFLFLICWYNKTSSSCLPQKQSVMSENFYFLSQIIVHDCYCRSSQHYNTGAPTRRLSQTEQVRQRETVPGRDFAPCVGPSCWSDWVFSFSPCISFGFYCRCFCQISTFPPPPLTSGCGQVHIHASWIAQSQGGRLRQKWTMEGGRKKKKCCLQGHPRVETNK